MELRVEDLETKAGKDLVSVQLTKSSIMVSCMHFTVAKAIKNSLAGLTGYCFHFLSFGVTSGTLPASPTSTIHYSNIWMYGRQL